MVTKKKKTKLGKGRDKKRRGAKEYILFAGVALKPVRGLLKEKLHSSLFPKLHERLAEVPVKHIAAPVRLCQHILHDRLQKNKAQRKQERK